MVPLSVQPLTRVLFTDYQSPYTSRISGKPAIPGTLGLHAAGNHRSRTVLHSA
jgi:hypothetical protein